MYFLSYFSCDCFFLCIFLISHPEFENPSCWGVLHKLPVFLVLGDSNARGKILADVCQKSPMLPASYSASQNISPRQCIISTGNVSWILVFLWKIFCNPQEALVKVLGGVIKGSQRYA